MSVKRLEAILTYEEILEEPLKNIAAIKVVFPSIKELVIQEEPIITECWAFHKELNLVDILKGVSILKGDYTITYQTVNDLEQHDFMVITYGKAHSKLLESLKSYNVCALISCK